MAQIMSVRLSRSDAAPWGFRLQGGKDFGAPLCIQKVNGGSPAERAGLQAGDAVIKVNNTEVFNLRHKDAQDNIVRAGNSFEITVQRGGSTWKPHVTPVGPPAVIANNSPAAVQPVTKTSLAANRPTPSPIGGGYNYSPAPFIQPQQNGNVPSIVNKQYNSPVGIYSEENIAETLSAQAEVLATGVLGVNFKKNEKNYDPSNSEVLKMLNEIANEPRTPEPEPAAGTQYFSHSSHAIGGRATSPRPQTPIPQGRLHGTPTPSSMQHHHQQQQRPVSTSSGLGGSVPKLATDSPQCTDCERNIVGVFVRIKNKNLHVECFKCATCGTSLKNVGYYNINNKLYCDVHAKLVARQHPPAPNLEPVTIPFGAPKPAGAISAALAKSGVPAMQQQQAALGSPQPSTLGPLPFHTGRSVHSHVQPSRPFNKAPGGFPAKSFNAPNTAPFSAAPSNGGTPFGAPSNPPFSAPSNPPFSAPSMPSAPVSAPFAGAPKPAPGLFSAMRPITNIRGGGSGPKGASFAGSSAPTRGRGVLNQAVGSGGRIPLCGHCNGHIRGPFVTALGKIWCPEHFVCVNPQCKRQLADIGFVEEKGQLYCEYCFEQFIAPPCSKCNAKIKGDCLNAIGKQYHPECFVCAYCGKLFGNNPFFLEDGLPYCQADWNELFTTKCFACGFPIEAGDRWVEALNNNYHSQCFNCTSCKKNLEGQSFFAKSGRPFCKAHAR